MREWRAGTLHFAKTLHMSLATGLFLFTPTLDNLDIAFQGLNTWHSFQYLAVVLYLNRLRGERGFIESGLVRSVSKRGFRLYGLCLAFTVGAGVLFLGLLAVVARMGWFAEGARMQSFFGTVYAQQHYFAFYSVVLSFLLIHYYFDHFLFLGQDRKITPTFAPLSGLR